MRAFNLVILIVFMSACSKGKGPIAATSTPPLPKQDSPAAPATPSIPVVPPTYTQIMFKQQQESLAKNTMNSHAGVAGMLTWGGTYQNVWCAPGLKCNNGVVRVSSNVGTCTGVLVAPKVVLTNRHCIEGIVREPNSSFGGQSIMVIAPQSSRTQYDSEVQYVVNLIAISPTEFLADNTKPDYAFLLLRDQMERIKPAKMNLGGIHNDQTYYIYGVSPYGDAKDPNAIERRECHAVYGTTFAPNFDSPLDTNFKFADCPIGPSNSGSPVFNKEGELVGLIGGQLNPQTVNWLNTMAKLVFYLTDEKTTLGHIGWGTNLACMPDIRDLSKPINPACDIDFSTPLDLVEIAKPIQEKVVSSFAPYIGADQKFRYKVERANEKVATVYMLTQMVYLQVPECIRRSELSNLPSQAEMQLELRMAGIRLSKYWKPTDAVNAPSLQPITLKFSPEALKKKDSTELTLQVLKGITIHRSTLRVCEA